MATKKINAIGKATIALTAATAVAMGGVTAAGASPLGSLSSLGSSAPKDLEQAQGKEYKLGNVGGPAWNVDVYKQLVTGAETVRPGATVKTRIKIQGVKGEKTKVSDLIERMPESFQLVKVETFEDGLLGGSVKQLDQSQYGVTTNDGVKQVNVGLKEGLLIKGDSTVSTHKSLVVDFTWKAGSKEGTFATGGGAKVGAVVNNYKVFDNGPKITVKKGASKPSGSISLSS
ncbi:hypothetical protein [Corynebacterium urealyticum]|uniref:hypothetical protein n=1 Tax=Corynebacterium urealyticum TaxID=43771 RepID=UPI00293E9389|nr:hypothetical protein [Corynebacterium urealyticum]WOH94784.1 hypothetical protein RZ943_01915 [Corynebacterium urealyticum]